MLWDSTELVRVEGPHVLSESQSNRRLPGGKRDRSLPLRERVELAAAADGGRVAHKKGTLLNGINRRLSCRLSPLFGPRNSRPRFQSGFHSTLDNRVYFRRLP